MPRSMSVAAAIALVLTACGGTQSESAPMVTGLNLEAETRWGPDTGVEALAGLIGPDLESSGSRLLVPVDLPDGAQASGGSFSITRSVPTGVVTSRLYFEFDLLGKPSNLSVSRVPQVDADVTCADRLSGETPWVLIDVRNHIGCVHINPAALSFIEWDENGARFHVETTMDAPAAATWLAAWTPVPSDEPR